MLDADVMVFATEKPIGGSRPLQDVPTFGKLKAVSQNRAVYTDATLAGAMYFISPLSLPYTLEHLTPQLEAAVRGRAPRKVLGG